MTDSSPDRWLPLRPTWLHILRSLAGEERAGYAIMQDVTARTDGSVRLWPATLYHTLRQLLDAGLIEESATRPRPDEDQRRRYYRLTRPGRLVLDAEARRLGRLARAVRADLRPGRSR